MKLLQSSLIADTFTTFCQNLSTAVSSAAWNNGTSTTAIAPISKSTNGNKLLENAIVDDYDALRVSTHVLIILREIHPSLSANLEDAEHMDNIIAAYINFLDGVNRRDAVPLYASKMSKPRARKSLATVLSNIRDVQEKETFIRLMSQYDIDSVGVLEEQTQQLIRALAPNHASSTGGFRIVEDAGSNDIILGNKSSLTSLQKVTEGTASPTISSSSISSTGTGMSPSVTLLTLVGSCCVSVFILLLSSMGITDTLNSEWLRPRGHKADSQCTL